MDHICGCYWCTLLAAAEDYPERQFCPLDIRLTLNSPAIHPPPQAVFLRHKGASKGALYSKNTRVYPAKINKTLITVVRSHRPYSIILIGSFLMTIQSEFTKEANIILFKISKYC
jgi:hypothetical protein